jgi:hypothetical protein
MEVEEQHKALVERKKNESKKQEAKAIERTYGE